MTEVNYFRYGHTDCNSELYINFHLATVENIDVKTGVFDWSVSYVVVRYINLIFSLQIRYVHGQIV
jgi:hypothetical protein